MPGFSQLKKLSSQILKLGNEINIRAERGEKALPFPVPDTIPDIDDSEDFIDGMPEKPKTPEEIAAEEAAAAAEAEAKAEAERKAKGEDDLFGSEGFGALGSSAKSVKEKSKKKGFQGAMSFLEEEEDEQEKNKTEEPPPKKGISGSGYSGFGFDDDGNLKPTVKSDGKPDISSLMGEQGKSSSYSSTGIPDLDALLGSVKEEPMPVPPVTSALDSASELQAAAESESETASKDPFGLDDLGGFGDLDAFGDLSAFESSPKEEPVQETVAEPQVEAEPSEPNFEETPAVQENDSPLGEFDMPDFGDDTFGADSEAPVQQDGGLPEPNFVEEEPVPAPQEAAPALIDDGIDLSDLGIDGIEIEDYTPVSTSASPVASENFDVDSILGTKSKASYSAQQEDIEVEDVSFDDLPKKPSLFGKKDEKSKSAKAEFKPQNIEDDIAILKPDIFTDNPVTSANPPFYVTEPFGKLPKSTEDETMEAAAQDDGGTMSTSSDDESSGFGDIDFDAIEKEEATSAPSSSDIEDSFVPVEDNTPSFSDSVNFEADIPSGDAETNVAPSAEATAGDDDFAVENYETPSSSGGNDFDVDDMFNTDMMSGFGSDSSAAESGAGDNPLEGATDYQTPAQDDNSMFAADLDFDMDSMGGTDFGNTDVDTNGGMPDFGDLGGTTDFSKSDNPLSDFEIPDTDAQLNAAKNDFELSGDDFSIPGFSEDGADPYANKKGSLDNIDFSAAVPSVPKQRNSLTEAEFKQFKKNLSEYPLNVRITVEDMIVKNEFTDEVVFELIDKILEKVTARQLAGYLEKMLDISLQVPRDFEKRTAAEYEAYKASFGYQLKARILPAVILGILAAMLLFCIGYLGHMFIYKPLKAESLYKQGYTLLKRDEYPQSQEKFNEALTYKSKKKWFYKYAQGYRAHRQYERAELFYKNILLRFNHDKSAGLEYADMAMNDLGDYERAEEIIKREVLDYHVNDPDGILALGDIYLDWATEQDSTKFQDAFDQYSLVSRLYGEKKPDLYQSRFLRYNIRTDQLHNVLELKGFFYPREKSLSASDWTELSGYLMDKLYGELPRDEEYLRGKIEDLRDMMLFAIKAEPQNPIASYNLSRYLVEVGDHTKALSSLQNTEKLFDQAINLKKRDVYKQFNNYRLLGEEYLYDREYILARETFTKGLNLFEKRQRFGKIEGDKNVGALYSDMGNLEYFISGDLPSAKRNYENAIANEMDTPSIRYRVGYIDYSDNDYASALNHFLKASEDGNIDSHNLLALGNTLSLKNDNYAAQSYYDRLLSFLDFQREKYGIVIPQIDSSAGDMVETYMKAANNLGVSQFRVSRQSGDSSLNAKALVNFQNSIRYYDALTRNQETMVRLPGSNLAEQNLRYATNPISEFEPAIYTEIPRMLDGEKGLEQ